jgi:hypothetical protein
MFPSFGRRNRSGIRKYLIAQICKSWHSKGRRFTEPPPPRSDNLRVDAQRGRDVMFPEGCRLGPSTTRTAEALSAACQALQDVVTP